MPLLTFANQKWLCVGRDVSIGSSFNASSHPFILPLRIGEENSPGARIAFRHNAEQGFD